MSAPAAAVKARQPGKSAVARFAPLAVLAILIIAMVMNTKFLTKSEAEELVPKPFDAKTFVDENFDKTITTLETKGTDLVELAPAVAADKAAACTQFGVDLGAGSCAFPVKATGTVTAVDSNFINLTVPGLPEGTIVRVPVGTALNGTPVRDAAGYKFADFPGQTQYQQVSNEFKAAIQSKVLAEADPANLTGKQVSIVGAYALPGPATAFTIQPMKITVS